MSTIKLDVIYEDNHLLVINKPAGILTQPSGTEQQSIEALAKLWLKEKYHKEGNVFLHAIHRLDKPVSGIVLFAKTSKALSRLQAKMRQKEFKKIYYAQVEGLPAVLEDTLEHYIVHDDFQSRIVSQNSSDAKLARLHYRVLSSQNKQSLLEVTLETGRYHQIRVQLSAAGMPIIGDTKYGSTVHLPGNAIALHHGEMHITHPISGETLILKAKLSLNLRK